MTPKTWSPEFMEMLWSWCARNNWDKERTEQEIRQEMGIAKFTINISPEQFASIRSAWERLQEIRKAKEVGHGRDD